MSNTTQDIKTLVAQTVNNTENQGKEYIEAIIKLFQTHHALVASHPVNTKVGIYICERLLADEASRIDFIVSSNLLFCRFKDKLISLPAEKPETFQRLYDKLMGISGLVSQGEEAVMLAIVMTYLKVMSLLKFEELTYENIVGYILALPDNAE